MCVAITRYRVCAIRLRIFFSHYSDTAHGHFTLKAKYTHKSISSAFAGLPVRDDDGLLDIAVHGEVFPEALVRRVVGESADEELGPCGVFLSG